jgi:hypothetical protein
MLLFQRDYWFGSYESQAKAGDTASTPMIRTFVRCDLLGGIMADVDRRGKGNEQKTSVRNAHPTRSASIRVHLRFRISLASLCGLRDEETWIPDQVGNDMTVCRPPVGSRARLRSQ